MTQAPVKPTGELRPDMNESHPSPDPCPFCGASATVEAQFGREWWVQCENNHSEGHIHSSEAEAIAAWNRRADRAGEAAPTPAEVWHDPDTGRSIPKPPPCSVEDARKAFGFAASPPTGQAIPAPSVEGLEEAARICERLRDDHIAGTRSADNPGDWCAQDGTDCDFVCAWNDAAAAIRQAAQRLTALPAALADTQRLDWLSAQPNASAVVHGIDCWLVMNSDGKLADKPTLREALDAAMLSSPAPKGQT